MTDFVISAPDLATFQAGAQSLDSWSGGAIVTQGHIPGDPDPMASYFLNIVGAVPDAPGYWARLRINGNNPFASGLMAIPSTLTVYSLVQPADGSAAFWSHDGTTFAPSYVGDVGVIA